VSFYSLREGEEEGRGKKKMMKRKREMEGKIDCFIIHKEEEDV